MASGNDFKSRQYTLKSQADEVLEEFERNNPMPKRGRATRDVTQSRTIKQEIEREQKNYLEQGLEHGLKEEP